ncbi:MAG: hypothetical protein KC912_12145 [Proteobacteria bacterium]|nr:hypothetical protein [Pseudomonadota bacterium]
MKKWTLLATAAATLTFGLACGGGGGLGGGFDNVGACEAYVAHHNALECTSSIQYESSDMCPEALNMNPNDMSEMYQCMIDGAKCNGEIPDFEGMKPCSSL